MNQRPSSIRVSLHYYCDAGAEVAGSNPAQSLIFFRSLFQRPEILEDSHEDLETRMNDRIYF